MKDGDLGAKQRIIADLEIVIIADRERGGSGTLGAPRLVRMQDLYLILYSDQYGG
jgi:hypothetical protein